MLLQLSFGWLLSFPKNQLKLSLQSYYEHSNNNNKQTNSRKKKWKEKGKISPPISYNVLMKKKKSFFLFHRNKEKSKVSPYNHGRIHVWTFHLIVDCCLQTLIMLRGGKKEREEVDLMFFFSFDIKQYQIRKILNFKKQKKNYGNSGVI